MADSKSLADRFIEVMAMLKAIDPPIEEPARHMMRRNRNLAESIIDSALRQSFELAWQAQDMPVEVKHIVDAARQATPTTDAPQAMGSEVNRADQG